MNICGMCSRARNWQCQGPGLHMLATSQDCKADVAGAGKAGDGGHGGGVVLEGRPQRALQATIGLGILFWVNQKVNRGFWAEE